MLVEIELPDLEGATKALEKSPELCDWAITRTLNDVAASGKAAGTEVIFTRYYFESQGPVQRGIKVKPTSSPRMPSVIRFEGTRFPLKQFLPSATLEGIDFM